MFDVSAAIDCFLTPVTLVRPSEAECVDGFVEGTEGSEVTITAALYPASSRDMTLVPEGQRSRQGLILFSRSEMRAVTDPAHAVGDRFERDGETFEVQQTERWDTHAGNFYRAIAVKVPVR